MNTTTSSADAIETRFFEHEHRRLRAGLAILRATIAEAHRLTRSDAMDRVVRTLAWLRRDVLPHAAWEEGWLFPHLDGTAGTPWATQALRVEHEQIRDVATFLEGQYEVAHDHWTAEQAFGLVVALARLETLVSAHLAQEERFVLPLLELAGRRAEGLIEVATS